MRYKLWITAALTKWLLIIVAIAFARGFPPPVWASVCGLVFIFGHLGAEYLFPGGYHALQSLSGRRPFRHVFCAIYVPFVLGLLLAFVLPLALRHQWLSRPAIYWFAVSALVLIGFSALAIAFTRDFLILRHWPHEPIA